MYKNYFMKLIIVWLIMCHQPLQATADGDDQTCDNGNGNCKVISDCYPLKRKLNYDFENIPYCDALKTLVCCPKPIILGKPQPEDSLSLSERKCLEYKRKYYEKCNPQGFITGGTKATAGEFPPMALLGYKDKNTKKIAWKCGGTLLSANYVLTASHCVQEEDSINIVRLGELDYNSTNDLSEIQDFLVKNLILHPHYSPDSKYNDIALIELDGYAELNSFVVPACLPTTLGYEYTDLTATGWGSTGLGAGQSTHLLKVKLERFTDEECKKKIGITLDLSSGIRNLTEICVGSFTDNRDTCTGDSGGPLFTDHTHYHCMLIVLGITSHGLGCGFPGYPGVYINIFQYKDWIQNIVWNATDW